MEVRVDLAAGAPARSVLRVSYTVRGARWAPLYDARLDSGSRERKPALELVRRAEIVQQTGEDWSDVALSVSTVRTAKGGSAPELRPLIVRYPQPAVPRSRAGGRADQYAAVGRGAGARAERGRDARGLLRAAEREAAVETGGYQVVFRVPGRNSVVHQRGREGGSPRPPRRSRPISCRARRPRSTRPRSSKPRSGRPTTRRCCPAASRSIATASMWDAARSRSRRRTRPCGSASAPTTR